MMKLQSSLRPSQSSIRKNSVRRPVPEYNSKGKSEKDFTSLLKIPKK